MGATVVELPVPNFDALVSQESAHEAAQLFPIMSGDEIMKLAEDIRTNGQHHPVVLTRRDARFLILDGRNRILACRRLGLTPQYVVRDDVDPVAFVVSENLQRRHLDESQRAMVAARLASMRQGARTDLAPVGARSQEQAAEQLNVSRRNVQRARAVLESGTAPLVEAVERGQVTVNAASAIAALPSDQRAAALEEAVAPRTGRRIDHAKREADVRRLHDEGVGTSEIAARLQLHPSLVSDVKVKLGISANSPKAKLWRDIEHVATTLDGAKSQIAKLADQLPTTGVNATDEEIDACSSLLSQAAGEIRRLATALRAHRTRTRP